VFDDAEAAQKYAQKEKMSRLRKGWILNDPAATAGQPRMHRLLTGAFTGSMAIEAIGERLLCVGPASGRATISMSLKPTVECLIQSKLRQIGSQHYECQQC